MVLYMIHNSSRISAIGYDEKEQTLVVVFVKGGKYKYFPVEKTLYELFCTAESAGKFFESNINHNPNIKYERLED